MKIYLAGPISGKTIKEVETSFSGRKAIFEKSGYNVFNPMVGKGQLRVELKYRKHGYDHPLANNHAIVERDRWMVTNSDVIFVDLMCANEHVSIGSMMELAWAHDHGIHTVVAMPEDGPHAHAFVIEAADVLFHSSRDAIDYLTLLVKDILNERE